MNIDRRERQGVSIAKDRITFCLNQLEARNFKKGIDWDTEVVPRLTIEELIGALVSVEQELIEEE